MPNLDWNHAWGATPANIIPRQMCGIQPKTAGGSIVSIKPQLSKLNKSDIVVPMLKGLIKAKYQRKSKILQEYIIEIPANVSAEMTLQTAPEDTVLLNGEKVDMSFGTIRLSSGVNKIELKVNTF